MASNTCEINVGRLLEIRVSAGYQCVRDVDRMITMLQTHFGRLGPGERCVIAADWRCVGMMSPDTAIRAREMLTRVNPRVIRSSILTLPERSLANLQVMRLVREAECDNRRHFISPAEQYRWLAEVLTEPERTRLSEFLELSRGGEERPAGEVAPRAQAPAATLPITTAPGTIHPSIGATGAVLPATGAPSQRPSLRPGGASTNPQASRSPRPR